MGVAVMVDRRAMNHMKPETRLVHLRLEAWASWAKGDRGPGQLPPRTLLGRLIEEGPGASQASGSPELPQPIAEVDAAVGHLGDIDRKVIRLYYLQWEPVECLARKAHMRVREFQAVLRRARWRVGGFLAALP